MIQETYKSIIKQLEEGSRPRVPNNGELINEITSSIASNHEPSKELMCVICHLATPYPALTLPLLSLLNTNFGHETQIFVLEAIQKHVLDARMVSGDRLTPGFLKTFNEYLISAPKNVLFFAVGIVEGCGNQAIYFRQALKNIKWGYLDAFKKEYRETITRIDELEKRWQKLHK